MSDTYKDIDELIDDVAPDLEKLKTFYGDMKGINPSYSASIDSLNEKLKRLKTFKESLKDEDKEMAELIRKSINAC